MLRVCVCVDSLNTAGNTSIAGMLTWSLTPSDSGYSSCRHSYTAKQRWTSVYVEFKLKLSGEKESDVSLFLCRTSSDDPGVVLWKRPADLIGQGGTEGDLIGPAQWSIDKLSSKTTAVATDRQKDTGCYLLCWMYWTLLPFFNVFFICLHRLYLLYEVKLWDTVYWTLTHTRTHTARCWHSVVFYCSCRSCWTFRIKVCFSLKKISTVTSVLQPSLQILFHLLLQILVDLRSHVELEQLVS